MKIVVCSHCCVFDALPLTNNYKYDYCYDAFQRMMS